MSHIVTIQTEIRDVQALRSACRRLEMAEPVHETARLFQKQRTGYCVRLPNWLYPVVCDTDRGQVHYDNFGGRWGKQKEFDLLLQGYAVEKTTLEARRQGHSVSEQQLQDGSIRLQVMVGENA